MGKRISRLGNFVWRHKYFWTLLAFAVVMGFLDPNSLMYRHRLRAENEALRNEIAQYDRRYVQETRRLEQLRTSEDAMETVARVSLLMKTDDEDLYIIEEER